MQPTKIGNQIEKAIPAGTSNVSLESDCSDIDRPTLKTCGMDDEIHIAGANNRLEICLNVSDGALINVPFVSNVSRYIRPAKVISCARAD